MELVGAIVSSYKSLDQVEVPLGGLTVLFGPNGAGKTNVIEALGAHDPLARAFLRRVGGQSVHGGARVGLVTRFEVAADGTGPDEDRLLEMLAAPWAAGVPVMEITEGLGAYCGSCWWLQGGDLYEDSDRASLTAAYEVIRQALLADVPADAHSAANRLLDLLLDQPTLIVQEDFAVELSFDRAGRKAAEIHELVEQVGRPEGVFGHLLGPLRSWTGRWPPLTTMTRGPEAQPSYDDFETITPTGFEWVTAQLGGVRVVSGDVASLEATLDESLITVHDRLWHRPDVHGDEPADEFCESCLRPDHGGRVDPEADPYLAKQLRSDWTEHHDGWSRIRPSLLQALGVLEGEANRRLPLFVAEQGHVRLRITEPSVWVERNTRCEILFEVTPGDVHDEPADWDGLVGVAGFDLRADRNTRLISAADLGAGLRRWVATAVRLAVDGCESGEVAVLLCSDVDSVDGDGSELVEVLYSDVVQPQMLLIDEPEQHLHPHAQHVIARWAAELARSHRAIVVATHSPAFFALPPEQATVCEVRRIGHRTRIRPLRAVHGPDAVIQARQLGFELGMGHDALAQLTRAVSVVEGDWDRRLLHHFFADELAEQRILVVVLQGSDEVAGLADAAVIPALGLPVVALLDDVRATSAADLAALPEPLSKAERGLRDLAIQLGDSLRVVRYEDPDVICALPEAAVRAAYPDAAFPGWNALLAEWEAAQVGEATRTPFKRWALRRMGLSKRDRMPSRFFHTVLEHDSDRVPSTRFRAAALQLLAACD